ncbi:ERF family protein [Clostridium paraputrificum]|uniref:ERF family protein n=1 Tax=Clostridium paraputrificum TaxID=29363 RepID=UPI0026732690|nr:ERF family protein [Clostridium paraputrificum]
MSEEVKKLNLFQKIQKARVELQKREIKKTGYNKYSNYYYFELSDFLSPINEICGELGLYTEFQYSNTEAWLTIYDVDNTEEFRQWNTPVEVASLKGCSMIQNIGGTQSFARRYLYMMAFEIAESDAIDNGGVDEEAELGKQKINKASVLTINGLIDETKTDKKKFLEWAGVEKVEDITNNALGTCINMLNKKKKDLNEAIERKKREAEIARQQEQLQKDLENKQEDFEF